MIRLSNLLVFLYLVFFRMDSLAYEFEDLHSKYKESWIPNKQYVQASKTRSAEMLSAIQKWEKYAAVFDGASYTNFAPDFQDGYSDYLGAMTNTELKVYSDNECEFNSADTAGKYCKEDPWGIWNGRGEIVLQSGESFLNNSTQSQSVLIHELGHSIGMGHAWFVESKMNYPCRSSDGRCGEAAWDFFSDTNLWPYDVAYMRNRFPNYIQSFTDLCVRYYYADENEEALWLYVKHHNYRTNNTGRHLVSKPGDLVSIEYHQGNYGNESTSYTARIYLKNSNNEYNMGLFNKVIPGEYDNLNSSAIYVPDISSGTYDIWVELSNSGDLTPNNNKAKVGTMEIEASTVPSNSPPNAPSNLSPSNGATGVSLTPTLAASSFIDLDTDDTHWKTWWDVRRVDDNAMVWDSGWRTYNLTSTTVPTSANLQYNTQYKWRVRYMDNHGTWSEPLPVSTTFTTGSVPVTVPSTPSKPSASDSTYSDKVKVSWSSVSGATSYRVYRCTNTSTSSCSTYYTDSSSPYDDTSATAGVDYYYRLKACNSAGCSGFSTYDAGMRATVQSNNPVLEFHSYVVDDDVSGGSNGDGDGTAENGETIELKVTLENTGNADATNVAGILSTTESCIIITDDNLSWGTIVAGGTDEASDFDFEVNSCPGGSVVTFRLDITSDEGSWSDTFSLQIYGSSNSTDDFWVENSSIDLNSVAQGGMIDVSTDQYYDGNSSDTLRPYVGYYLSSNSSLGSSDILLDDDLSTLHAGDTRDGESATLVIPSNTSEGTYYILFVADYKNEFDESDEGNNVEYKQITVTGSPDLIVQSPSVSDSTLTPGQSFTASATVMNLGAATLSGTPLRYYLSDNMMISTDDVELNRDWIPPLSTGATSSQSDPVIAPSTSGTYYIGACVDPVTDESDIGNNCSSSVQIEVSDPRKPDLYFTQSSLSVSVVSPGEQVTLTLEVGNQGDGDAPSTSLDIYRSADSQIDSSDLLLETRINSGLSPYAQNTHAKAIIAPNVESDYWYGGCIQSVANESDTTNNCSTGAKLTVNSVAAAIGDAVDYDGVTWQVGGNAPFLAQSTTFFFDGDAAQSGGISDNGSSWMRAVFEGAGTLSFRWKISSEQNFDKLILFIDGIAKREISGIEGWQKISVNVPAGAHTISWVYQKDFSGSSGSDTAWVDKVEFEKDEGGLCFPIKAKNGNLAIICL